MSRMSLPGYELVRELGRGSAGVVYLARDVVSGESVAIKQLHTDVDNLVARGRFAREARIMQSLRHPSLVSVHNLLVLDGSYFLVLEYVDGISLADVLPLIDPVAGVAIVEHLAGALDVVHGAGVVHRDVKPANALVSLGGECKLTDFGVARFVGDSLHVDARNGVRTKTGTTLGSPAYMAAEVAAGQRDIDRRADVYSLAVLAYRIFVGQLPFTGDPYRVLQAQINDPPPIPSNVKPSLTAALDDVLLRGLAKKPATRYQTAGAFSAALASALGNSDVGRQSPTDALAELARSVARTVSTDAAFDDDAESSSSTLGDPTITMLPRLPKADVPIFRPRARHRVRILLFGLAIGGAVGIIVALVRR